MTPDPRDRLIVALDLPSVAAAETMVARLGDSVSFYKIGYQLAFAGGLSLASALIRDGKQVFLDLKLHDIGNTVAKGVESVAQLGARFLTVHAYPQTMKAAVEAKSQSNLKILAVTVLTSYDDADIAAAGYDMTVGELAADRAAQARDIGIDGLVCSAAEVSLLRPIVGREHAAGDAGHPAGRRRKRRPEAHHDAYGGDCRRRGLSCGRPPDPGSCRPESRSAGNRRRDCGGCAQLKEEKLMAKGYWIASVDVTDPEGYKAYVAANAEAFRKFGAKFLTRGGKSEPLEGKLRSRIVVIEFPSYEAAVNCYRSPEYDKARKLREGKSNADLVAIEGYDGAQP